MTIECGCLLRVLDTFYITSGIQATYRLVKYKKVDLWAMRPHERSGQSYALPLRPTKINDRYHQELHARLITTTCIPRHPITHTACARDHTRTHPRTGAQRGCSPTRQVSSSIRSAARARASPRRRARPPCRPTSASACPGRTPRPRSA